MLPGSFSHHGNDCGPGKPGHASSPDWTTQQGVCNGDILALEGRMYILRFEDELYERIKNTKSSVFIANN